MLAGHKIDPQNKQLWNSFVCQTLNIPRYVLIYYHLDCLLLQLVYPGQEIFHAYGIDYWQSSAYYFEVAQLTELDILRIQTRQLLCTKKKKGGRQNYQKSRNT